MVAVGGDCSADGVHDGGLWWREAGSVIGS